MPCSNKSLLDLEYELTTLVRALEALKRRRNYPLERSHYLLLLQLSAGPLSIGEIAERLLLDNSTVTRQINAMLKKELLKKIPNPNDGRSSLVSSTRQGKTLAKEMHELRLTRLDTALKQWTDSEKQALADLTHRLTHDLANSLDATTVGEPEK